MTESEKQAEVHVQLFKEAFEDSVATKGDIKELKFEIESLRKDMESRIDKVQLQITVRFGAMQVATIGILATLMKLL